MTSGGFGKGRASWGEVIGEIEVAEIRLLFQRRLLINRIKMV